MSPCWCGDRPVRPTETPSRVLDPAVRRYGIQLFRVCDALVSKSCDGVLGIQYSSLPVMCRVSWVGRCPGTLATSDFLSSRQLQLAFGHRAAMHQRFKLGKRRHVFSPRPHRQARCKLHNVCSRYIFAATKRSAGKAARKFCTAPHHTARWLPVPRSIQYAYLPSPSQLLRSADT